MESVRILTILQARLTSRRFPEKILADLCGRPLLAHVLARAQQITPHVVLAVPAYDPRLSRLAHEAGAALYVGDQYEEADVLGRVAGAARAHGADILVRVTGDCPLLDPAMGRALLARFLAARQRQPVGGPRYADNLGPSTDGFDVEVMTDGALHHADARASDPEDREHVTPFVRRAAERQQRRMHMHIEGAPVKCSVDTEDDAAVVRGIMEQCGEDVAYRAAVRAYHHAAITAKG